MSCAGCDDCPSDAWHLHITVGYHHNWRKAADELGYNPLAIENLRWLGTATVEYIPTAHFKGTYRDALVKIFKDSCAFAGYGLTVLRAKIEGAPGVVENALYYEAHVKMHNANPRDWGTSAVKLLPPVSRTDKGYLITIRRPTWIGAHNALAELGHPHAKIEACAFDTSPELDAAWINQGVNV